MTFLKKAPTLKTLNLSNILEISIMNKITNLDTSEEFFKRFENISASKEKEIFKTFCSVLRGQDFKTMFFLKRFSDKTPERFGLTLYSVLDGETKHRLDQLVELVLYVQHQKSRLFDQINVNIDEDALSIYKETGYDIHVPNDIRYLMSYVWNYELICSIEEEE